LEIAIVLTSAQLVTLKAAILADSNVNSIPANPDGDFAIAAYFNTVASPVFLVYRSDVPVQDIYNQITWANMTPTDAPDGTQTWANRSLACQGKQFNVQIILQGQASINAAKANVRAGLQDGLTNVPSGVAGALVSAGWNGVRDNALARAATRAEKLYANTTGGKDGSTATLAATMVVEGSISSQDVNSARGLP
jgi:hypothetical protein